MKTVVQRVTRAEVRVGGDLVGRIAARPAAVRRRGEG
jgi:D-Tyr-tRNAtyr deacylase